VEPETSNKRKISLPQRGPEPDREVLVPAAELARRRAERGAAQRRSRSLAGSILDGVEEATSNG